jgi:ABC-type antimicrobial peptide transport system permease subunit
MEMVAFFAATALLLAGLGIHGTISYVVNEQRREIAIRLALGAQRGNILKTVLRRGLDLAAAGAGLGVAGALIVSDLIADLLYGVSPTDLPTLRWRNRCAYHCHGSGLARRLRSVLRSIGMPGKSVWQPFEAEDIAGRRSLLLVTTCL